MEPHRQDLPRLRRMGWRDVAAVHELERELFPEDAWSVEAFWAELAGDHPGGDRWYLVAEDGAGRLVGYAGLWALPPDCDVQTIAVAREHWGTGLGARLLEALLAEGERRGCRRAHLEVHTGNPRARRLYHRFGFTEAGVRRHYYGPDRHALVMVLPDLCARPRDRGGRPAPAAAAGVTGTESEESRG